MAKSTVPERSTIPEERRWNTRHLFKNDKAWHAEREALAASFSTLAALRGTLGNGAEAVLTCLQTLFEANRRLGRLESYAARRNDEDTRVTTYQAMREVIDKVGADLRATSAFIEPQLLALPTKTIRDYIADPRFADYDRYLRELLRQKKHVLSPKEEALLARTSLMQDAGHNTYSAFTGADLTFPRITDEKGREVQLSQALFARYRASADRAVRKRTFDAFFSTFAGFKNTFASLLGAQVNANLIYARARRYDSALEAALDPDEIPVDVYTNMISAVNKHLPKLHRYLALRRDLLGLDSLRYYDLYPPIVEKVRLKFPYDKGCRTLVEAMAPLGSDYARALERGLQPKSGWIDALPNKGKRSGAYMDGSAYDVHPYVLGNYLEDFNSLSMMAHEMGHAMHSYYSNQQQPYPKADYSIFVAEVASTLNEHLLAEHLLAELKGKRRLFLLGEQLEGFRQTFFRQAMFAEFELDVYRLAEAGEAITADALSERYLAVARRYYGHDEGVVTVDDAYGMEWAYIPHFYYNFYVFQYVTGITAATALAEGILAHGAPARDRYIENLLYAGCRAAPIDILAAAGVDLTTTAPYDVAMSVFERTLDQAEAVTAGARGGHAVAS
ncbi:MAG: oligoendopeptidase F [Myxococcales bacterium]|nr:oligoendopeptidase F [Myxococcales bacterium]